MFEVDGEDRGRRKGREFVRMRNRSARNLCACEIGDGELERGREREREIERERERERERCGLYEEDELANL